MGFTGAQIDDDDGVSVGKSIALHYIIALSNGLIVSNLQVPLPNQHLSTNILVEDVGTTS